MGWKHGLVCAAVAALSACGGGGGGDGGGEAPSPMPTDDTQAPTLGWRAPANLATGLTGSLALQVDARDDTGVAAVEYQVDGEPLAEATAAPFGTSLDTTRWAAGQHVLRARARDAAGNRSAWQAVTLRFDNPGRSVPAGFAKDEAWVTGLSNATAFTPLPDGRWFVAEQGGRLRVVAADGMLLTQPFHAFTVDAQGERGLIGVALHPRFPDVPWVYVHYTASAGGAHGRISRLVAQGDRSDGSETVLIELPPLSAATNHNGGALHFGPDGHLYIAVGENANAPLAQNLASPFGKLLRVDENGGIPADNPFAAQQSGLARAIWAYGLRNPFTFGFDPASGRLHINDVGAAAWEEIDLGQAGANYGWPASEGPQGITAAFTAPLFAYAHAPASPPGSGPGGFLTGFSIVGAAFAPAGAFGAAYDGSYFFADFVGSWVARLNTAAQGGTASTFATVAGSPVDLRFGADRALYVLTRTGITRIARTS